MVKKYTFQSKIYNAFGITYYYLLLPIITYYYILLHIITYSEIATFILLYNIVRTTISKRIVYHHYPSKK